MGHLVEVKGIRDGLLVRVSDDPDIAVFEQLNRELKKKKGFIQGSRIVLEVGHLSLEDGQVVDLQKLFDDNDLTLWAILSEEETTREAARRAGLATRLAGSATDLDGKAINEGAVNGNPTQSKSVPLANALLLRETVRSGRSVFHEGHVVILGDVNPGAEVIATGSVVVWGRLRGLVHAGAFGDATASICALDLNPTQLRIADQIAVPPKDNRSNPIPEQATIADDQIIAEPWPVRHSG